MPIRAATDDDIEDIRRIAERSWELDYPDILTRETIEAGFDEWYAPEGIAAEVASARSLVLVADRDGEVVGFVHAARSASTDEGYILRLYVDPDHRRENVGHELLERACVDLTDQGVERINAMVLAENDPGNSFYERFGFELDDESETTIGGESYRENRYVLEGSDALVD